MFCYPGYKFFSLFLQYIDGNYLEIGVFDGDSIASLGSQYPMKKIYAVDPFIEDGSTNHTTLKDQGKPILTQRENTYANIEGKKNIKLFEMPSSSFSLMLTDEMIADMNISCILIDGSHHYEDVIIDAHLAMRLIGNKVGAIIFDDIQLPGVNLAYHEWKNLYSDKISQTKDLYDTHPENIIAHLINFQQEETNAYF